MNSTRESFIHFLRGIHKWAWQDAPLRTTRNHASRPLKKKSILGNSPRVGVWELHQWKIYIGVWLRTRCVSCWLVACTHAKWDERIFDSCKILILVPT